MKIILLLLLALACVRAVGQTTDTVKGIICFPGTMTSGYLVGPPVLTSRSVAWVAVLGSMETFDTGGAKKINWLPFYPGTVYDRNFRRVNQKAVRAFYIPNGEILPIKIDTFGRGAKTKTMTEHIHAFNIKQKCNHPGCGAHCYCGAFQEYTTNKIFESQEKCIAEFREQGIIADKKKHPIISKYIALANMPEYYHYLQIEQMMDLYVKQQFEEYFKFKKEYQKKDREATDEKIYEEFIKITK